MSGPFQSHGFQTSVDTARQQTTTIAGLKRPHQNLVSKEPATSVPTSMTAAAANAPTVRQSNDSKRRPVDFIRASAATHEIRIAASPIRSILSGSTANNSVSAIPPLAPPPPAPSQSSTSDPCSPFNIPNMACRLH